MRTRIIISLAFALPVAIVPARAQSGPGLARACFAAQAAISQAAPAPTKPKASAPHLPTPPPTPQEQFLPYWTTEEGWHTDIQLRNNRDSGDLSVTPVLRSAGGTETSLPPVVVKPKEVQIVDLMDAIQGLAPQLNGAYGSVVLRYSAPSIGNLFAMGMIHGVGHPFAIHIDPSAQQPDSEAGGREGIWWLPRETTSDLLILTNQGRDPLNLTVSVYDEGGKEFRQNLLLGPAATARYSVRQWVAAAGFTGTYGGVRVSAAAHTGSLDTLHFLFDEKAKFSALLKMFEHQPNAPIAERDFAKTGVWTQHAPMVALSTPDPALAFPPGTVLQPQLFIRNTIGKPSDVKVRFNWRGGMTSGSATGPVLHLAPFETRRVDVAALQDGKTLLKDANWASVTLTTNGNPDEVMAVAASFDSSLQHGAQTPFSDQLASTWKGSVWEYDAYHDSLITIGNGGAKPTRAAFTIFYNQGTQHFDLEQDLQPDEQMWIDVGQLIREHVPDKNGNVLPADLTSGTYEFRDLMNPHTGMLYEGKVVYDKTYGHAAYGCAYCCGYTLVDLFYDPIDLPILTGVDDGVVALSNCTGAYDDVSDSFYANWASGNTSIVTVDYYGTHTGQAVGSTTSGTHGYLAGVSPPRCPSKYHSANGGANVITLSCSPSSLTRGSTVTCSVNNAPSGSTFSNWKFTDSSNNTVNGSGTASSWSGTMVTSGTVTVDVTAGGGGNPASPSASVTVTNRNWHTNPASPVEVSNGTFYTLPVPPQPTGSFAGVGISNWRASYGTLPYLTIGDGGPNQGYTYFTSNFSWTNFDYRYEINPDLENTGSTFYLAQCGNYNATTNPNGFISGSNLLTQTRRHEYNSLTVSHYAFYSNAISSAADNLGDYLEQQIAIPGANLSTFNSNVQSGLSSRLNDIGAAASQENPPWPVNHSETNVFLGYINYAPYTACQ